MKTIKHTIEINCNEYTCGDCKYKIDFSKDEYVNYDDVICKIFSEMIHKDENGELYRCQPCLALDNQEREDRFIKLALEILTKDYPDYAPFTVEDGGYINYFIPSNNSDLDAFDGFDDYEIHKRFKEIEKIPKGMRIETPTIILKLW